MQCLHESKLLAVERSDSVEDRPILTVGFNDTDGRELFDDAAGSPGQSLSMGFPLEDAVDQESKHMDEQHGFDALIFVQVNG